MKIEIMRDVGLRGIRIGRFSAEVCYEPDGIKLLCERLGWLDVGFMIGRMCPVTTVILIWKIAITFAWSRFR